MATLSPESASEGPTAAEWERHKTEIIELYRARQMRDVRALMESKHGFSATLTTMKRKRMYDTRFRRWGVSKIMKSAEKDRMAQEIARMRASDHDGVVVAISDKKLKKIIRHVQTQARKERLSPAKQKYRRSPKVSRPDSKTSPPTLDCENTPSRGFDVNQPDGRFDSSESPTSSLIDTRAMLVPNSSLDDCFDSARSTSDSSPTEYPESLRSSLSVSPVPVPLSLSTDRIRELVLFSVRSFYCSSIEHTSQFPADFDIFSLGSTAQSKAFWSNIKQGIYLAKISDKFTDTFCRSQQALQEAEALADQAIVSTPFDCCREMLSTLSPANVPAAWSAIRQRVLACIKRTATMRLGTKHPLVMLSDALSQDGYSSNVSLSGLDLLLGFFQTDPTMHNISLYKMTETIISFLRRAGQLEDAKSYASDAFTLAKYDCGVHSLQARKIATQLAHVLTSLGDYGRTLPLRHYVVEQPVEQVSFADSEVPVELYCQDSTAIYAMEDLAEYYVRFGNLQEGSAWLLRAESIALKVWGPTVATGHISDKLTNLIIGFSEGQVVDGKIVVAT